MQAAVPNFGKAVFLFDPQTNFKIQILMARVSYSEQFKKEALKPLEKIVEEGDGHITGRQFEAVAAENEISVLTLKKWAKAENIYTPRPRSSSTSEPSPGQSSQDSAIDFEKVDLKFLASLEPKRQEAIAEVEKAEVALAEAKKKVSGLEKALQSYLKNGNKSLFNGLI